MALHLRELHNRWLALQVRAGWESMVSVSLRDRGYETFLPVCSKRRKWSDRIKLLATPLFPGYLFVRFQAFNSQPIVCVPGTIRLLGAGNRPIPVEDGEIESLKIMNKAAVPCGPCAFLEVGQQVEIREGALCGLRGYIVRTKTKDRLVISVVLLQKSVFVEIDGYDVQSLREPPRLSPAA